MLDFFSSKVTAVTLKMFLGVYSLSIFLSHQRGAVVRLVVQANADLSIVVRWLSITLPLLC